MAVAAVGLCGLGAAPAGAVTVYGGGTLPASVDDGAPRFLVAVDGGRARILGHSGGRCSNGREGFGRFLSQRFRLRRGGRFDIRGSFAFRRPGGVAGGSYRIRGRVRAGSGVVNGVASVRLSFRNPTTGRTIICKSTSREFRARNPSSRVRRTRGPLYGVTSQGLPIVLRPTADSSALRPVSVWATLRCNALGTLQTTARITAAATAPGAYAKTGKFSGSFIPALGSQVSVPLGTYANNTFAFDARLSGGQATGTINLSARVGNAQNQLIDTCSAPPITFRALA